jgi:hypothetical protein
MSGLDAVTCRRLLKLPQSTDVWEGDRRSFLPSGLQLVKSSIPLESEHYVLWVNGTEGAIRSIGRVESASNMDAIVDLLVQAIESPPNADQKACRPRMIILRDRELYLYLQSIAQKLKIQLELLAELPVVDQVFEKFHEFRNDPPPLISPKYGDFLLQSAENLWETAPWVLLQDHQTLEVELNQWGLGTLYVTVLGNLGLDFGVLAYRSLESLKAFRAAAISQGNLAEMEAAFLGQNCLFLNYEFEESPLPWLSRLLPFSRVEPSFGSLDGKMIPFLSDDETIAFAVILEAIHRFIRQNRGKFFQGAFPSLTRRQKIVIPEIAGIKSPLTVKVSTMPQLAKTFIAEASAAELDEDPDWEIRQDLIPDQSFVSCTLESWDSLEALRSQAFYHQSATVKPLGDGFPVLVVQTTSVAKAKELVKEIRAAGGLLGIGFNPAIDPFGNDCLLGLLKMQDETMALFAEVDETDPDNALLVKNWRKRCKVTKNYCALLIAKGNSGKTKGRPLITDTIGFFEVKALSEKDFDLGVIDGSFDD